MKRRFVSILCAATMVASLMTGATVVSAADKDVKDISIGVSFGQNVHPFFVAMQKGIEQACTDLGVENCNILAADSSLETQVSQIENLVTKGSDVLLLNPYDSDGVVNAVEAATEKGVGVFTMDVDCEGSTSFVASDNKKVGEMLADAVIEQLDGKGKIAIIDGITVTSLKDRTDGFMNKIKDTDIEVVAEQQTAHARDTALASAENILQAHPDIDAFVGVNENSGMAILSAATSAGLSDLYITTVDATAENMSAIRDGKVAIGVSQDPYKMGYTAAYKPEFTSTATDFRVILKNVNYNLEGDAHQVIHQVTHQVIELSTVSKQILTFCTTPKSKKELAVFCGFKDLRNFTLKHINPLLESGQLEMTIPDKPKSRNQKYITVRSE